MLCKIIKTKNGIKMEKTTWGQTRAMSCNVLAHSTQKLCKNNFDSIKAVGGRRVALKYKTYL